MICFVAVWVFMHVAVIVFFCWLWKNLITLEKVHSFFCNLICALCPEYSKMIKTFGHGLPCLDQLGSEINIQYVCYWLNF